MCTPYKHRVFFHTCRCSCDGLLLIVFLADHGVKKRWTALSSGLFKRVCIISYHMCDAPFLDLASLCVQAKTNKQHLNFGMSGSRLNRLGTSKPKRNIVRIVFVSTLNVLRLRFQVKRRTPLQRRHGYSEDYSRMRRLLTRPRRTEDFGFLNRPGSTTAIACRYPVMISIIGNPYKISSRNA